ncbi:fibronectin type III domain-containing protein [Galbibacter sp. PAP.153]|uniref:fibronectin type III domain-containing protein n=1 Tax=Galbibacter sp. PAP.153 TaxID=3104623 RepID=UPI0030093A90
MKGGLQQLFDHLLQAAHRKLFTAIYLLLFCHQLTAQVYPVQVHTQLIPPYSLKLSDYVTAQSDKFIANVLMTDVNEYNRQLRFRLTIKGNGLNIRSNDFVIGANPVFADGGVPLRLTNIDLRPYFELQNLQGITPQQYNNPLPDGNYSFCLEVFDWVSGQRLSNPQLGCANAYLIVNDPPFLNLPRKGDLVEAENPQNIVFNWTPRHLNAINVQYEFELRELWDTQIGPQAAFLASPNLYQTTTRNNTLLYGPGKTPLLENKTYAWRVRALVSDGISETSVFRNNGHSEIFYFTYTADCSAPGYILAKSLSSDSEEITWQPNLDHQAYKVQYKKKGVRGAVWFDVNAINPQARIYNLEPGTTYEFRVGGQCMLPIANQEPRYSYSAVQEFTTPIKTADSYYNCGIAPEIRISNKTPLPSLAANEVFTAGDFPVTVKEVEGQNGTYSGAGYIVVPYLADTKIAVEFNNIRINTDYQLYAGTLYTTYDPNWGNVDDVRDELDAVAEIPEAVQEIVQALDETLDKIIARIKENININQQANIFIELMQEALDNPNNGLSIGEQENLKKFIGDKDKVKEAIRKAKQDIAENKNDKIIKQNLVSGFAPSPTDIPEDVEANKEIAFEDFEVLQKLQSEQPTITYISPAGVPVILPKEAKPHFLKKNSLNVAYGVLCGFTLNDSIYNGYHKEGKFTGYKIAKGKAPYTFSEPISNIVKATIIQRIAYLDCQYFVVEGTYQAPALNKTGEGDLITKLSFTGELELVKNDLATYNECLPDISRIAYDEHLWGQYNTYGRGGFLRFTQAENGSLVYVYIVGEGENGSMVGWQYHVKSGKWYIFNEPPRGCLSCDLYFLFGAIFSKDAGHLALDGLGMVPVVGEAFDAANGIWYTVEGEYGNAAISFASTIPLVYATTVKNIGKVVKLADGTYQVVKFSAKETEGFIAQLKRFNLDADALKVLNKDLNNKAFAEAIQKNPKLVEGWKLLNDAGRTGLKTNVNALEALQNLRSHPKMTTLKQAGNITDIDLASIQGFSGASFEEVTNQITRLLDNHSSTLNGFESVINTMKRTAQADNAKKGMYWMIRDVTDDVDNLAGKNLTLEFGIDNARGTTSRIDVFCEDCIPNNLKIEYKSGPGSISSSTIKEQFIERDLFNANSLDEIQWRMEDTGLSKEKFIGWMTEHKTSIENLGYEKVKSFYPNDEFMTSSNFADRFISKFNNESIFNSIFK